MHYPAHIYKEDGEYIVTISHPDGRFQGVASGATKKDALQEAEGLLVAMLASALKDGDEIPAAEECDTGNIRIILPPMLSAKALLYREMKKQGKRKATIARMLGVNQKQMDRVLNPNHRSTLQQLQAAAEALGKTLDVRLA